MNRVSGGPHLDLGWPMGNKDDRLLWEILLKPAKAHLGTARAMYVLAQRMMCKESAKDNDPDRLETWYVDDCNAEAGADFAGQCEEWGVSSSPFTEYTERAWFWGRGCLLFSTYSLLAGTGLSRVKRVSPRRILHLLEGGRDPLKRLSP